jgi:hypothetical protein
VVTYEWFLLAMCGKERRLPEHEHDARLEYTNKVQERRRRLIRARGERLAQRFINTSQSPSLCQQSASNATRLLPCVH